jgi:hypothetical protein
MLREESPPMFDHVQENYKAAVSYIVGFAGITLPSLTDLTHIAQSLTVIGGLFIVVIRLAHDTIRLIRFLKSKT